MHEPSASALAGDTFSAVFRRYLLATRPKFFTASVLPVVFGTSVGVAASGGLDLLAALIALVSIVLLHAGVNVLNDVYDERSGNDGANEGRIHPFTGGSRFIQNGVLGINAMSRLGVGLVFAGMATGLLLAWLKGPLVLAFGFVGILLGVLYSMPPIWLSARGLGEAAVGIGFGVLPVVGAAWLQGATVEAEILVLSLPVTFWVINVLLINEVPDAPADASVGRKTLVVRFGNNGAASIYGGLGLAATCAALVATQGDLFPLWGALGPLVLLVLVARTVREIRSGERPALRHGIEMTLVTHTAGILWMTAIVITGIVF